MSQLRDDVEYTSSWVPEPRGRGTLSILYTCTFTLVLCVYTAIHLNIPPAGERRRWQFLRKIRWMFIAIFAPEVVLFTAAYQYWNARKFCQEMESIRVEQGGGAAVKKEAWWKRVMSITKKGPKGCKVSSDANSPQSPEPFSITYGFYVVYVTADFLAIPNHSCCGSYVDTRHDSCRSTDILLTCGNYSMGGLTVDVSDMHDSYKSLTLSPYGVIHMARKSSWEHFAVSDTTIDDKSKADMLAKSLVILQVSWLFLQCVTRASQGRPLTILEVHTLVHAVCAMLMYGLWFKKPLDIRDATVVDSSGFADDLALELLNLHMSLDLASTSSETSSLRVQAPPSWPGRSWLHNFMDRVTSNRFPSCRENQALVFQPVQSDGGQGSQNAYDYQIITPSTEAGEVICTLYPGQILHCGVGPSREASAYVKWNIESWSLTGKDVLRWNRAARARSKPTYNPPFGDADAMAPPNRGDSTLPIQTVISTRSSNFQEGLADGDSEKIDTEMVSIVGLCSTMSAYGAIHLALWNFAFPSHAEMLLWKVSACTMVSTLPLYFVFLILIHRVEPEHSQKFLVGVRGVFDFALIYFLGLFLLVYVYSRVFIVIESFLSLRMVPRGVYEGITWADYIPHL